MRLTYRLRPAETFVVGKYILLQFEHSFVSGDDASPLLKITQVEKSVPNDGKGKHLASWTVVRRILFTMIYSFS